MSLFLQLAFEKQTKSTVRLRQAQDGAGLVPVFLSRDICRCVKEKLQHAIALFWVPFDPDETASEGHRMQLTNRWVKRMNLEPTPSPRKHCFARLASNLNSPKRNSKSRFISEDGEAECLTAKPAMNPTLPVGQFSLAQYGHRRRKIERLKPEPRNGMLPRSQA